MYLNLIFSTLPVQLLDETQYDRKARVLMTRFIRDAGHISLQPVDINSDFWFFEKRWDSAGEMIFVDTQYMV
jgi:hypothetical protein